MSPVSLVAGSIPGKGKSKRAKGKTKDRDKEDRGAWDKTDKGTKKTEAK